MRKLGGRGKWDSCLEMSTALRSQNQALQPQRVQGSRQDTPQFPGSPCWTRGQKAHRNGHTQAQPLGTRCAGTGCICLCSAPPPRTLGRLSKACGSSSLSVAWHGRARQCQRGHKGHKAVLSLVPLQRSAGGAGWLGRSGSQR